MEKIKFHWLKSGHCLHPKKITYRSAPFVSTTYPSFFGVIRHATYGVILYDTGYSENFFEATKTFPEKLYALVTPVNCSGNETCAYQLQDKGINPDDVKMIVISHFHADHICGLKHFKNAKFYFFNSGLQFLQKMNRYQQVSKGYLKNLLPDDFFNRMMKIENTKRITLPDSLKPFELGYDLLGDNEIIAVPLPGHLVGHTGLFFKVDGREVFIIGDSVWHLDSIRHKIAPHFITRMIISDWRTYIETINNLHSLQSRNTELFLLPSHCTENEKSFL